MVGRKVVGVACEGGRNWEFAELCFSHRHRTAIQSFVVSMVGMSLSGAYIAFEKSQIANELMAFLTLYLVKKGWATAQRKQIQGGVLPSMGLLGGVVVVAAFVSAGWQAVNDAKEQYGGYQVGFYVFFGSIAVLGVAGDLRVILVGGIVRPRRIARHLWRMCFGMLIATTSFFLGQQKVFPVGLRGLKVWLIPPILVLIVLVYWLVKVRRRRQAVR